MDHSLLDDDYAMVQQADISTASSSICAGAGSLDGSEMTTNGAHSDIQSDPDDMHSSELADMALGPTVSMSTTLSPIQEDDRQALSQTAPRMPGRSRDLHFKLLLLGESGLGKTTFTRQLLRSYAEIGSDIACGHDGSSSSMEQFKSDPGSLCTELKPLMIADKNLRLLVKIQDVPGWGDDVNIHGYLQDVMTYIMQQRAADYSELKGGRAFAKEYVSGCLTHSVTACLYFLPPHRTKPVDLILMSALSQHVALIPVIAKADTMTQEETKRYRQEILDRCLNPNNYVNRSHNGMSELKRNIFSFDIEDMQALQGGTPELTVPPFTIISSESFDQDNGPVRRYLWGDCEAANRKHSDFILLKRLLMGDKVNSLWRMLDDSYDRYVSFARAYEAANCQLESLVTAACAACDPHLEFDEYSKSKMKVTQLMADKEQLLTELAAAHAAAQTSQAQAIQLQADKKQLLTVRAAARRLDDKIEQVGKVVELLASRQRAVLVLLVLLLGALLVLALLVLGHPKF